MTPEGDYRDRILNAMLDGIGEVGWADLTISDVVRRARVSKRTFYEYFATKEQCLLALCEHEGTRLVDDLEAAINHIPYDARRIGEGAKFYLAHLQARPRVVRALTVEILQLGSEGLAVRRRVMRRFAALLQREINATGTKPPISIEVAMVLVGGINELTLEALDAGKSPDINKLAEPIVDVIMRMLDAPSATRARRR